MIKNTGQTQTEYKNQIISELANNKEFTEKVNYLGYINSVSRDSFINEDVRQAALLWVCKLKPEKIIELYEKSPADLLRYAVHIAWRQGFCRPKKGLDAEFFNPKHSLKFFILHNSSFNQITTVDTNENFDSENTNQLVIYDGDINDKHTVNTPEHSLIKSLEPSEIKLIEAIYYAPKKRRGKRSRFLKAEIEYIKEKITILYSISNSIKSFKPSFEDKLKLVLTYQQWIDYNMIWDEDLTNADKMMLMKVTESTYYNKRKKILLIIEKMSQIINDKIKKLDNEN